MATAMLAVAGAALLSAAEGSAESSFEYGLAGAWCLLAAVCLQVLTRRWLCQGLIREGLHRGLSRDVARARARIAVRQWLARA